MGAADRITRSLSAELLLDGFFGALLTHTSNISSLPMPGNTAQAALRMLFPCE
jgi:hypothetical protein